MGTPDIAVPALRLLAGRADVSLVVTQPDRPAGRGMEPHPSAVKTAALALGIPVWQPGSLKGCELEPRLQGHDLFVVMAYGELLRRPLLALPKACINLHASLLPRWRGASPLQAAIRAGDTQTGVCVMAMAPQLDAGPVYLSESTPIGPHCTLPELHDRVAEIAAVALGRFLDQWPNVTAVQQDESLATHCRKLTSDDGRLDWQSTASELDRWVRAYTPAPGCWTMAGNERLRILGLEPLAEPIDLAPGCTRNSSGQLVVGCRNGTVAVTRLQAPGRKAMSAEDFLRGHRLPERFG